MWCRNISHYVTVDHMTKNGPYRHVYDFAVDCDGIDISGVTDIHKYLMKSYKIAQMLRFIK